MRCPLRRCQLVLLVLGGLLRHKVLRLGVLPRLISMLSRWLLLPCRLLLLLLLLLLLSLRR